MIPLHPEKSGSVSPELEWDSERKYHDKRLGCSVADTDN